MSLQEHKYTHLEAHSEFRGCHRDQSQIAFVYISIQMGVGGGDCVSQHWRPCRLIWMIPRSTKKAEKASRKCNERMTSWWPGCCDKMLQIRPLDCGNLKWISNQHFNTFRKWLHEQPLLHLATGLRLPHRNVFQHRNQMGCNLGRSICWWCGKSLRVEKVWKSQLTSTKHLMLLANPQHSFFEKASATSTLKTETKCLMQNCKTNHLTWDLGSPDVLLEEIGRLCCWLQSLEDCVQFPWANIQVLISNLHATWVGIHIDTGHPKTNLYKV